MKAKTEKQWQSTIKRMCRAAGIDPAKYAPIIATLAAVMAERDEVLDWYIESGKKPIIAHTNKGGATNPTVNPLLAMWDQHNKTALAYWRELGLTPAAYKKVCGAAPKNAAVGTLAAALREIEFEAD